MVATEPGVVGNVAEGAVTFFLTAPPDAVATVTTQDAMFGGTDEETDEALRERVLGDLLARLRAAATSPTTCSGCARSRASAA